MRCDECRWWREPVRSQSRYETTLGRCLYNPPRMVTVEDKGYNCWPRCDADDYCSKHTLKEDE